MHSNRAWSLVAVLVTLTLFGGASRAVSQAAGRVESIPGMPPVTNPTNLYSETTADKLSPALANVPTRVYVPKDSSQRWPILLTRTPYALKPYGSDSYQNPSGSFYTLATNQFVMVTQDVRGRYGSEGSYVHVRPFNPSKQGKDTDESTDAYDTIDWLVKNVPNNNGKVGVFGISYPGFYTSMSMIDSHPALKAASPQAPISDWFCTPAKA